MKKNRLTPLLLLVSVLFLGACGSELQNDETEGALKESSTPLVSEAVAMLEPPGPSKVSETQANSVEQSLGERRGVVDAIEALTELQYVAGETSLEERILRADAIALVQLERVVPTYRQFLGAWDDTKYMTYLEVTYMVEETLKGDALPELITVEVMISPLGDPSVPEDERLPGHDSAPEATEASRTWYNANPVFDNTSIVFLKTLANSSNPLDAVRPTNAIHPLYVFLGKGGGHGDGKIAHWGDSVTINGSNKVVLPLSGGTGDSREFYLDSPPAVSITLPDLKAKVTAVDDMVDDTIAGHRECLEQKFLEERNGRPKLPEFWQRVDYEEQSGQPAGTVLNWRDGRSGGYMRYELGGPDADLLSWEASDDDSDPDNGYRVELTNNRPLPAGEYTFHYRIQYGHWKPCGHISRTATHVTMRMERSEGILHELFFDPVTVGSTIKADASNGVLKPTSFTDANGGSATIGSISYESSTVKIGVIPDDALDDHIVDIIELDGTVSLSLDFADATLDAANDTLSWSVSSQPWEDGDKLLVRVREVPPPPVFGSSSYTFDVAEDAENGTVVGTVSATDPAMDTVTYAITGGNETEKFSIDTNTGAITVAGALDYESVTSYTLTVEASNEGGGSATATVEISVTDVSPEKLPPAPEDLAVSLADGTFTITWSPLTGAARYEAQHHKVGSIDDWTSLPETTGTSATYSPTDGPACGTTYEFRVRAYGDGTTYVADWGAETSVESVTTSACNRAPAFGASTYSFTISENAAVNASVGTVSASDPDAGDTVRHTITAGNDAGKFTIASGTGAITVAGALDPDAKAFYALTVEASDGRGGVALARVGIALILTECKNGTVVPRPAQNPGLVRDCSMLLAARDTLAGDASLDWSADTRINDWQGVTVHSTPSPFVRVVLLTNLGLTGSIPAALGGLEDVRRIDLDDNMLTGGIPLELGSLSDLELLYLFNNRITGELPAELGELSNLKTLSLSNNMLTGSIPTELGKLRNLRELLIEVNSLTGGIPAELGALPNLWSLYLSDNMLTGGIPAELGNLRKLRYFVLEGTSLGGEIPSQLGDLTRLEVVYLRNNGFTGAIPTKWGELSNLTHLYISSGNTFTGCIPSGLRDVTNNDLDGLGLPYCASESQ